MTERPTGQPERLEKRWKQSQLFDLVTTTIRVPRAQRIFLDGIAKLEGTTSSELIRSFLDEFIEKKRVEYKEMDGEKRELGNKIEEVVVYQAGLERVLDNIDPNRKSAK